MDANDLHDYQLTAVEHIMRQSHCGLFLEMGLGKTVSTLTAINKLIYEELEINKVLIIAPKRVAESVWLQEARKWDHTKHLKVVRIIGTAKQRLAALREKADIYTIGRDNVPWLCGQYGGSMLPFDMLVIDELSSFKNSKTVRFKALKAVQPRFKRIVGLTGTPAPNGLLDLWSQIYLLDRGERLGRYISSYRENYFKAGESNGHVVYKYNIRKGAEEMIHEKISDICMSMKAEDYLKLPGRIVNDIKLDLGDELMEKYEEFKREQVLSMFSGEDTEITAVNAAALINKLLQFSNGAIYDSAGKVHHIHDVKLDALEEIIETANGSPVLVAYTFKHDVDRMMERLKKYKPVKLANDAHVEAWNRGEIPVLIMHPASGGHGLNLQKGGHIIVWYGQQYSLELYQQFNARLDRQAQTNVVIINRLIANKTMDVKVVKSLESKDAEQDKLMQAVKAMVDKYINNFKKM